VSETALVFGPTKSIVGIVCDPPASTPRQRLGVVILNAGVLHRVGPARIHVSLARELAARGLSSLRFDFSGIGDSARFETALPFTELAMSEAREAMDFLERSRGIRQFALLGICSGADIALRVARAEPRVVAAALVDVFNMPTPWLVLRHSSRQALKLSSWVRFLSGRSQTLKALRATALTQQSAETSIIPSYGELTTALRALTDRGTSVLLAFTGNSPAHHHFRWRLRRKLSRWPKRHLVRRDYLHDSDHTFTLLSNQERFVSLVAGWLTGAQGAVAPPDDETPFAGSKPAALQLQG
jgi:pimeloyl-ACP methyl ester carboxylesterase